jgi:hypothetical protein
MAGSITAKRSKRKGSGSGSIKSSSVSARVSKFDDAVMKYIKRNRPSEKQLLAFVQDEWQSKTHSHLPTTTAKKVAKRFMNISAVGKFRKTSKTRKQRGGMASLDSAYGALALPGAPLGTTLLRVPDDITTSSVFAASSPVSYYQIAQDRSAGTDSYVGLKPGPGMGSNAVSARTRRRGRQGGGGSYSMPSSVAPTLAQSSVGLLLGQQAPIRAAPNPVVPGFESQYTAMKPHISDAHRIDNQLGLVWKTTA